MTRLTTTFVLVLALPALLGSCAGLQREIRRAGRGLVPTPSVRGVSDAARAVGKFGDTLIHPAAKMSPEQAYYIGRTVTATLLAAKYDNQLVGVNGKGNSAKATPAISYLQNVAAAIAAAAVRSGPDDPEERAPTTLRVGVVSSPVPNAYSAPGGFTLITTGMLSLVESEDELAGVLAHEMAHVSLAHGLAAIDKAKRKAQIDKALAGLGAHQVLGDLADDIVEAIDSGYPDDWEYAADARGAEIAQAAGYDPTAMRHVLQRLQEWQQNNTTAGVAKTHPSALLRIEKLAASFEGKRPAKDAAAVRQARFDRHLSRLVPKVAARARDPRAG